MEGAVSHTRLHGYEVGSAVAALDESFDEAVSRSGSLELVGASVAGRRFTVAYAGAAMQRALGAALSHLVAPAAQPSELEILVWDSASTGTPAPPLPEASADDPYGAVYVREAEGVSLVYQPGPGLLLAYDRAEGRAWCWARDARALPYWDGASPFRRIFQAWLGERGVHLVHAGAIGFASGGVLVVGRGGSGKSSTCLASIGTPLRYAGDDYVAVSVDGRPRVHGLYCSGKLEPAHARRFDNLAAAVDAASGADHQEKLVLDVGGCYPDALVREFPVEAVVLPFVGERTRFTGARPAAVLAAVGVSTVLQAQPHDGRSLNAIAQLLRAVPCLRLELGPDVSEAPAAVARLLGGGA